MDARETPLLVTGMGTTDRYRSLRAIPLNLAIFDEEAILRIAWPRVKANQAIFTPALVEEAPTTTQKERRKLLVQGRDKLVIKVVEFVSNAVPVVLDAHIGNILDSLVKVLHKVGGWGRRGGGWGRAERLGLGADHVWLCGRHLHNATPKGMWVRPTPSRQQGVRDFARGEP